ncbi:MAG: hypothetical protein RL227_2068 [Pseudomonadota bacterium]
MSTPAKRWRRAISWLSRDEPSKSDSAASMFPSPISVAPASSDEFTAARQSPRHKQFKSRVQGIGLRPAQPPCTTDLLGPGELAAVQAPGRQPHADAIVPEHRGDSSQGGFGPGTHVQRLHGHAHRIEADHRSTSRIHPGRAVAALISYLGPAVSTRPGHHLPLFILHMKNDGRERTVCPVHGPLVRRSGASGPPRRTQGVLRRADASAGHARAWSRWRRAQSPGAPVRDIKASITSWPRPSGPAASFCAGSVSGSCRRCISAAAVGGSSMTRASRRWASRITARLR